jgi:hypothetical protein
MTTSSDDYVSPAKGYIYNSNDIGEGDWSNLSSDDDPEINLPLPEGHDGSQEANARRLW